jgi:HSP20 family protein
MAENPTNLSSQIEDNKAEQKPTAPQAWHPFENLRREVDRLFEDFGSNFWRAPSRRSGFQLEPFWRREWNVVSTPAVDIIEKDNAFEVTADLPGMDEKNIEVTIDNGTLTIKGEKQEEKEEKKKDYHLQERRFGSFARSFRMPEGVDTDKIDAQFKGGVLRLTLPKTAEAQKPSKKIEVKAG